MSQYTSYLKLKINNEQLLNTNDLIPNKIIDGINIKDYLFSEIRHILINKNNYLIFIKNKYLIKNKYNFFIYFNLFKNTLLYKLVNFYYIIYNNYNNTLNNKEYNNYKINWECNYGYKYIKSFILSDLYLKYIDKDNIFLNIIKISIELWNEVYLFYLGICNQCDIKNNYIYLNITEPYKENLSKEFNFFSLIDNIYNNEIKDNNKLYQNENNENENNENENNENNEKHILLNSNDEKSDKYLYIFQYVEVKDTDIFEFNFDFLKKYKNYPDTILKEKNKILNYTLKDNDEITIIGWYINENYTINKKDIDDINYNNTIKLNKNNNMYVYILFENN
tara:strand:+ start:28 stop:1035 length:1008 start_codon:yes stop_codon:yes gene_type:complete